MSSWVHRAPFLRGFYYLDLRARLTRFWKSGPARLNPIVLAMTLTNSSVSTKPDSLSIISAHAHISISEIESALVVGGDSADLSLTGTFSNCSTVPQKSPDFCSKPSRLALARILATNSTIRDPAFVFPCAAAYRRATSSEQISPSSVTISTTIKSAE